MSSFHEKSADGERDATGGGVSEMDGISHADTDSTDG